MSSGLHGHWEGRSGPAVLDGMALRGLLDVIPVPAFVVNREGMVTGAWMGRDPDVPEGILTAIRAFSEGLPAPLSEVLPPEPLAVVHAAVASALDTGEVQVITYELPFNGRPRLMRARCAPCGPDEALWLVEDYTGVAEVRAARRARRTQEEAAVERLVFESMLAQCSQSLLAATVEDLDDRVIACLETLGHHFGADATFVCGFRQPGVLELVAQWRGPYAPTTSRRSARVRSGEFRYAARMLDSAPVLFVRDLDELPSSSDEQGLMRERAYRSLAWVRVGSAEEKAGLIGLVWNRERYEGTEHHFADLVRLGEAILSAYSRREAERLATGQRGVLEVIARGESLGSSLSALARLRETARSSLRCAVLVVDEGPDAGDVISVAAAPSFPAEAERLFRGLALADVLPSTDGSGDPAGATSGTIASAALRERLDEMGAGTAVSTIVESSRTGRPIGVIVTVDLDPDRHPLVEPRLDEVCTTLAAVAIERAGDVAEMSHQATHDPLTGAANRAALLDRLDQALLRARERQRMLAVLFCDLDRFKEVNDLFGHEAGDELLREVARRIAAAVPATDTVSRFGGDEFVVLLDDVRDEQHALGVADRVAAALSSEPVVLRGNPVAVTASIGLAMSAAGADHPEALVRDADVAMYRAKAGGRARREVFHESIRRAARDRDVLARDLAQAIAVHRLELHYQPLVSLGSGRVEGLEALVRWDHPERGMLKPDLFVPIAEETGLIVDLGRWIADEAVRQLAALTSLEDRWSTLRMHVNVSARQLAEPGFVTDLRASLDRWEVAAKQVALEITESVLMAESPATSSAIGELTAMGSELVLDDFGTGYASLTYLRRFPVRGLKIDRSFVAGLGERAEDDAVVRSVVQLGRSLGLDVVAEGVETVAQANHLRSLRCQGAQGYYYARPAPASDLVEVLTRLDGA